MQSSSTTTSRLRRLQVTMGRLRSSQKVAERTALLDTGCSRTLITPAMARELGLDLKDGSGIELVNASGDQMMVEGTANIWVMTEITKYKKKIPVIVVSSLPEDEPMLLGLLDMEHLNLLPKGWPHNRKFEKEEEEKLPPYGRGRGKRRGLQSPI